LKVLNSFKLTMSQKLDCNTIFDFVENDSEKQMLQSAYDAITFVDGWDFMKTYRTDSFMFESNIPDKLKQINDKIQELYSGHSGASYGCVMRCMESIGKLGLDEFKKKYLNC